VVLALQAQPGVGGLVGVAGVRVRLPDEHRAAVGQVRAVGAAGVAVPQHRVDGVAGQGDDVVGAPGLRRHERVDDAGRQPELRPSFLRDLHAVRPEHHRRAGAVGFEAGPAEERAVPVGDAARRAEPPVGRHGRTGHIGQITGQAPQQVAGHPLVGR